MTAATTENTARPRAMGYGCALGDRLFRLAVAPGRELTIVTAPLEAPRINTTSSPEEATAEFGLIFARSDFDGGAGLFRAHTEDAAPNRFWDSRNVSIRPTEPGDFPAIRLLHTTANIEAVAGTARMAYDDVDGSLYVTDGVVLRRTDNPLASAPLFADDNPAAGDILTGVFDVAVLGDEVYVALDAQGVHRKSSAGTWANWDNVAAKRVWGVKGRIVASDGRNLYELDGTGITPAPTLTLAPGETINDVWDGGSHVLVAASDGYVYAYQTDTGTLTLAAQTQFEGEEPMCGGQSQGVVGVGTAAGNVGRFYVGAVSPDTGQIVDQQLIRTWGETGTATDQTPRTVIGTRASLLTAVPDGTDTHLWRYDLITGGMSRDLTVDGTSSPVTGIVNIEGRTFAAIDSSGVWRESTTYAPSGYLIGPLGDFYSSSEKSWVGGRMETGELNGRGIIELYYTTDPDALADPESSSWRRLERRESGSGDPGEESITNVVARSLAGMVKLIPATGGAATPELRSFAFRAYPSSGNEDKIVTIPINVSDQIERPGRGRIRVKGRGAQEFRALLSLEGRPTTLRLYRPNLTIDGLVEEVGTPVQGLTPRGSVTVVSQVRVRGRQVSGAGSTTGAGPFGTDRSFATALGFGEST